MLIGWLSDWLNVKIGNADLKNKNKIKVTVHWEN